MSEDWAHFGGLLGVGLVDATSDLSCLDGSGLWLLIAPFEGQPVALRFETWTQSALPEGRWPGASGWQSSMTAADYQAGVRDVQSRIAAGDVYQVNLCRRLRAQWPVGGEVAGLARRLAAGNPAPYAAAVQVSAAGVERLGHDGLSIVSASPELFLRRVGNQIASSPIKGTAPVGADFLEKDEAENVMIVDLVRNDLSAVCVPGTVNVAHLLERQSHPGLDHLVSTVEGELAAGVGWSEILSASFPPGSVTGAPKSSALRVIAELEGARSFYCGAIGLIDAAAKTATLNVAIRTFWREGDELVLGVGSGITWGSEPQQEWLETELKASRLLEVASADE